MNIKDVTFAGLDRLTKFIEATETVLGTLSEDEYNALEAWGGGGIDAYMCGKDHGYILAVQDIKKILMGGCHESHPYNRKKRV